MGVAGLATMLICRSQIPHLKATAKPGKHRDIELLRP